MRIIYYFRKKVFFQINKLRYFLRTIKIIPVKRFTVIYDKFIILKPRYFVLTSVTEASKRIFNALIKLVALFTLFAKVLSA